MSQHQPSYEIVTHPRAATELEKAPEETRERLVAAIREMAGRRDPLAHSRATQLAGRDGLLRVRVGTYRAVLALDKPQLRLLQVSHRDTAYDQLDVAEQRRAEA